MGWLAGGLNQQKVEPDLGITEENLQFKTVIEHRIYIIDQKKDGIIYKY